MEWNGMETDMAHTDWSQLWSTGCSDRVASLSLSRWWRCYPTFLPPPTHSYVRPVLTHVSSAACYTGLRRLAVVVATMVDGTVYGDRLMIGDRSTWRASDGHVDTADVTWRPIDRPNGASTLDMWHLRPARPVTESDWREHGIPNTAGPRPAIGSNSWHAPISIRRPK